MKLIGCFFLDLSTLLEVLAQQYKDLDICDRARFYHQLLLTVSGEKVDLIHECIYSYINYIN